jgi:hypothetical protein
MRRLREFGTAKDVQRIAAFSDVLHDGNPTGVVLCGGGRVPRCSIQPLVNLEWPVFYVAGPQRAWGCPAEFDIFAPVLGPGVKAWHGF